MSPNEGRHSDWLRKIENDLQNELDLGDGRKVQVDIKAGSNKVEPNSPTVEQLWKDVKNSLNSAIKNKNAKISGL